MPLASRFCVFWIRKTMRNVTMVVPVLMMSCQVSEKWKAGPVIAHTTMIAIAPTNAHGEPTICEVRAAKLENHVEKLGFFCVSLRAISTASGGGSGLCLRPFPLRGIEGAPAT